MGTAIACNNESVVTILLEKGADVGSGNPVGNPLYQAIRGGSIGIAFQLLDKGAYINGFQNPLEVATMFGSGTVVGAVLERYPDIQIDERIAVTARASDERENEVIQQLLLAHCYRRITTGFLIVACQLRSNGEKSRDVTSGGDISSKVVASTRNWNNREELTSLVVDKYGGIGSAGLF